MRASNGECSFFVKPALQKRFDDTTEKETCSTRFRDNLETDSRDFIKNIEQTIKDRNFLDRDVIL
jgi:hypothetical protein